MNCAWCGDEVADGSHDECVEPLRALAMKHEAAARGAATVAETLLEEAAIVNASASIVSSAPTPTG